jgi:outer membrane protein OmpA-like peptidoglycan-associated protein
MVEFGGYAGAFIPSGTHELYDSSQGPQGEFSDLGPQGGLRLGYFPLPFVGVEGEGGLSPLSLGEGDSALLYNLRSHLVLQFPARVTPFVVGGGGFLGVDGADGSDVDRAAHWGGGVKVYLDSRWSVRADGRHLISAREGPNAGNTNHFEASVGVSFALYRAPERMPRRPAPLSPAPDPTPVPEPERDPEPDVEASGLVEVDPVEAIQAVLRDVRFAFDSAAITDAQVPLLERVLRDLRQHPDLVLIVTGHACDIGSESYNQALSERRARAVRDYLVSHGLPPARVEFRGLGESTPKFPNLSEAQRARNRRTEFGIDIRREPTLAGRR